MATPQASTQLNKYGMMMIFGSLMAVVVVFIVAIALFNAVYKSAADITPVIETTITAISTIAAAAFGVSVGTQAGSQAGQATANATKEQTARVKQEVQKHLESLEKATTSVSGEVGKLPQANGFFTLDMNNLQNLTGKTDKVAVSSDTLTDIKAKIDCIESVLNTLPI